MLKTFIPRPARALVATLIATMALTAPLPFSTGTASAATMPATSGTYIIGKISIVIGDRTDSTKPPALSSFDVRVDGAPNPVTKFEVIGETIVDLTLTSTVYSGSVITLSYNAPAVDNTLANNALQRRGGEDYASFANMPITNMGSPRPEPNTPGVATVVAGEESATVTVTAPTSGVRPTSYEVTASPGGATCTVTGASGSCTISGLTAGTTYTFTTIAKRNNYSSAPSASSASVTALVKTTTPTSAGPTDTVPAGYTPSWDKEPLTDSEADSNTVGYMPTTSPGDIIITDEFGFTLDKNNGLKPKIRMKIYAGKIKLSISATYKVGAKNVKYKCAFKPFGTTKKIKTAKWRWYTPKKACILPAPLVAAIRANTATLSATGKWTRQALTTGKKVRADNSKIKPRKLKYTIKAKPATIK